MIRTRAPSVKGTKPCTAPKRTSPKKTGGVYARRAALSSAVGLDCDRVAPS
jgi:hypothetical protein